MAEATSSNLLADVVDDVIHPAHLIDVIPDALRDILPASAREQIPKRLATLIAQVPKEVLLNEDNSERCRAARDYFREANYPLPFLATPMVLPLLVLSLAKHRNCPTTKTRFLPEYDYIVVGAGTAGSVMASRLSERPCVKVLLLEAGGDPPLLTEVPQLAPAFQQTHIDWFYKTVPLKNTGSALNNRQIIFNSGKVVGGSSILNAMFAVRGNVKDYDYWAAQGATGWSYKDVKPYFMKLENNSDPEFLADGFHAVGGPMSIEKPQYSAALKGPLIKAAQELGYKMVDNVPEHQTGFWDFAATMRGGTRCSTAKAYLVPAEDRKNLDIVANAMVLKILLSNKKAIGVRFEFQGKTHEVKATKEVILSAGGIASPQLLMISGIGPKDHLKEHGIPVVMDLAGVGENMQDHVASPICFSLDMTKVAADMVTLLNPLNQMEYIVKRTNHFAGTFAGSLLAFLSNSGVNPQVDYPDYQLYFTTSPKFLLKRIFNLNRPFFNAVLKPYTLKPVMECMSQLLRPKSRGFVRLKSANIHDHPIIDPRYFEDKTDLQPIINGMKTCRKICATSAMRAIGCQEVTTTYPDCGHLHKQSDAYLECMVKSWTVTIWHKSGTAKMGSRNDSTAVVDPELKVIGIEGLRVVDASIMPKLVTANTNIPIMMIAEKASDMIKQGIPCTDISGAMKGVQKNSKEHINSKNKADDEHHTEPSIGKHPSKLATDMPPNAQSIEPTFLHVPNIDKHANTVEEHPGENPDSKLVKTMQMTNLNEEDRRQTDDQSIDSQLKDENIHAGTGIAGTRIADEGESGESGKNTLGTISNNRKSSDGKVGEKSNLGRDERPSNQIQQLHKKQDFLDSHKALDPNSVNHEERLIHSIQDVKQKVNDKIQTDLRSNVSVVSPNVIITPFDEERLQRNIENVNKAMRQEILKEIERRDSSGPPGAQHQHNDQLIDLIESVNRDVIKEIMEELHVGSDKSDSEGRGLHYDEHNVKSSIDHVNEKVQQEIKREIQKDVNHLPETEGRNDKSAVVDGVSEHGNHGIWDQT